MAKDINTISSQNAKFIEIQKHFDELKTGAEAFTSVLVFDDELGQQPNVTVQGVDGFVTLRAGINTNMAGVYNTNDMILIESDNNGVMNAMNGHITYDPADNAVKITNLAIDPKTTAARPTDAVIGQMLFDTTLGKPIWCKEENTGSGVTWVDAAGTMV